MSVEHNGLSLQERLDLHLAKKRADNEHNHDTELAARAQQVRTLQGMTGSVSMMRCPHCKEILVDPRPVSPEDDYDSRL